MSTNGIRNRRAAKRERRIVSLTESIDLNNKILRSVKNGRMSGVDKSSLARHQRRLYRQMCILTRESEE